ncbi:MAG: hypothetical protein KatS3mg065_0033 [Chloroflexota bacterium]|nr:MAG: hypothetical protein KatS3mg065_0033 [Chloroflexota bacterium]
MTDRANERAPRLGGWLTTSVVGSHAHPGWMEAALAAIERGEGGPADLAELLDDAVAIAILDQERAGIDVVSDGEMRRAGFFTAEFYRHLTGVRPLPPERRWGPAGHDQQHRFEVTEPIAAPAGLGVVDEFRFAVRRTSRPLKVTIPGPFTLSGRLRTGPGEVYRDRAAAAEAFVPILAAELDALAAAGATFVQIDEPSPAIHPDAPVDFADLFNRTVAGVAGRPGLRLGVHLCFGNYVGRPLAKRTYRPVLDQLRRFRADELVWSSRTGSSPSWRSCPIWRGPSTSPSGSSTSRAITSRPRTTSPNGSSGSWRRECRRPASRSSPTAASARQPAGRRRPSSGPSSPGATSSGAPELARRVLMPELDATAAGQLGGQASQLAGQSGDQSILQPGGQALLRPALPPAIVEGRVIAIARRLDPGTLPAIAEALAAKGIRAFEVTLNSPGAVESIRLLASGGLGDRLLVGAGTVLTIEEAEAALEAGARFLVTPHLDVALVRWAAERGVPILPGAFTPTEILTAWRAGAAAVKLFPASVAGPTFIRDFRGPFPEIPIVPTGGVTVENAAEFLRAGAVAVGLGSWLTGAGDPAEVGRRAAAVVAAIGQRGGLTGRRHAERCRPRSSSPRAVEAALGAGPPIGAAVLLVYSPEE